MTTRKITALVIMGALIAALSATTAFADYKTTLTLTLSGGSAVSNPTYDETYTLTVPESLRITNTGWNAMDSMTVKYSGSNAGFDPAKKLVVTASSTNSFNLVADGVSSTISYFLATGENDTAATTSFTFTAAQITASASQTLGVNVGTFDGASDGTYTDEITYTVAIQDAGTTLLSLTVGGIEEYGIGNQTFYYAEGETWAEALANHPTENPAGDDDPDSGQDGFAVENGNVVYVRTGGERYSVVSSAVSFVKGNDVISSSLSYQLVEEQ